MSVCVCVCVCACVCVCVQVNPSCLSAHPHHPCGKFALVLLIIFLCDLRGLTVCTVL